MYFLFGYFYRQLTTDFRIEFTLFGRQYFTTIFLYGLDHSDMNPIIDCEGK